MYVDCSCTWWPHSVVSAYDGSCISFTVADASNANKKVIFGLLQRWRVGSADGWRQRGVSVSRDMSSVTVTHPPHTPPPPPRPPLQPHGERCRAGRLAEVHKHSPYLSHGHK